MHTREPNLLDPLGVLLVIDTDRMKGGALVVERQGMPRAVDLVRELAIAERDRPNRPINRGAKLFDRNAKCFHRIEQAKELDADLLASLVDGLLFHGLAHLLVSAVS